MIFCAFADKRNQHLCDIYNDRNEIIQEQRLEGAEERALNGALKTPTCDSHLQEEETTRRPRRGSQRIRTGKWCEGANGGVCFRKEGISSVQSLRCVRLFVTPWTAACQVSLSITISWSLFKHMSIESVTPSNHLILCRPLLLLP